MDLIAIGVWNGNWSEAVKALHPHSTELRIRLSGKKLVIKDNGLGFYACIAIGCAIEIPLYYEQLPDGNICPAHQLTPELRERRDLCAELVEEGYE
jgi:hypothetical protein